MRLVVVVVAWIRMARTLRWVRGNCTEEVEGSGGLCGRDADRRGNHVESVDEFKRERGCRADVVLNERLSYKSNLFVSSSCGKHHVYLCMMQICGEKPTVGKVLASMVFHDS